MSNLYYDPGPPASGQKVMLATTSYDSPDASYTYSIAQTRAHLALYEVQTAYLLLQGNCHVDDSRNTVVRDFLDSDCTELVFIDADVSWKPDDILALCVDHRHCEVIGGVYPYRREGGIEKMPYRGLEDVTEPGFDGLMEVAGLPTGFLRIRRDVFELMVPTVRRFENRGRQIPLLFERTILGGKRLGGDLNFCMKWRKMGGKVYAATDLYLGHCGKHVVRDSLAASLRRQNGTTLEYVATAIGTGRNEPELYREAAKAVGNPWGAQFDVLHMAVGLARNANEPILEIGSGLSTILMAAANPEQNVWAVEHSPHYAHRLQVMAEQARLSNIMLVMTELKDGWYDLAEDMDKLPARFSMALVDGPPRMEGDRFRFFDALGDRVQTILVDDADDVGYAEKLRLWAVRHGRVFDADQRAGVILPKDVQLIAAE